MFLHVIGPLLLLDIERDLLFLNSFCRPCLTFGKPSEDVVCLRFVGIELNCFAKRIDGRLGVIGCQAQPFLSQAELRHSEGSSEAPFENTASHPKHATHLPESPRADNLRLGQSDSGQVRHEILFPQASLLPCFEYKSPRPECTPAKLGSDFVRRQIFFDGVRCLVHLFIRRRHQYMRRGGIWTHLHNSSEDICERFIVFRSQVRLAKHV